MDSTKTFNQYDDQRIEARDGYGTEASHQRCDDLDSLTLESIQNRDGIIFALDLATGYGGQAIRMLQAGANKVVAVDLTDYRKELFNHAQKNKVDLEKITFIQGDLRHLSDLLPTPMVFNFISCQRALHYFPYNDAKNILKNLKKIATSDAQLYISMSGLDGEEGEHYAHDNRPVEERFCEFNEPMRTKQNALHPLCLYSEDDARKLLEESGWHCTNIFTSSFGTVKVVGHNAE